MTATNFDPVSVSAVETLACMRRMELSPVEVATGLLDQIEKLNPALNAVVTIDRDRLLADARHSATAYLNGSPRPLEGLPLTVKDTIETAGIRTTAGSRLLENYVPTSDAPSVARLRSAGGIILGKTNTPEFAMTFATDNDIFGRTCNPLNAAVAVGGSSGGEAAAIASRMSILGIGSDLAGSIRIPASFCGIVGLRPSVGRVPSEGHIPALPHPLGRLSVVGPMARTVGDADLLMSVLADDWRVQEDPVNEPKRIGIVRGIGDIPVSSEVMEAITTAAHVLENLGFEIQELSLPETTDLIELWDRIWAALGGARGLLSGHVSPDQETLLSRQLIRQFEGSPPPDAQALSVAWRTVGEVSTKLQTAISSCVAILSPVAAGPPTERAGQWQIDGRRISGIRGFAYSYVWTLAGCCAMSIPCFRSSVQLVARSGRDESLVDIARRLESASR